MVLLSLLSVYLLQLVTFPCVFSVDISKDYAELERKYTKVTDELEDMKDTLKNVMKEVTRVTKISRALDALCQEWKSGEDNSGEETDQEPLPDEVSIVPIPMMSLATYGDSTFRLEYESKTKAHLPDPRLWQSFSDGRGVVYGRDTQNGGHTWLGLLRGEYGASLMFKLDSIDNITLPVVKMDTNVQDEIVFEQGQPKEVRVRVAHTNFQELYDIHFSYGMYIKDRNNTGRALYVTSDKPGIVNMSKKEDNENVTEYTMIINADNEDYEGVVGFEMQAKLKKSSNSFVYDFSPYFRFNVRRSDHKHMFPDDFIGFMTYLDLTDGFECQDEINSMCIIPITLFGVDPHNITLSKYNNIGKHDANIKAEKYFFPSVVSATFTWINVTQEDAGRYVLEGTSRHGKVVQEEFDFRVIGV